MRALAANLALAGVSLSVACIGAEIVLRRLGYYGVRGAKVEKVRLVDDEIVDYRRVPNTEWIHNNLRYRSNEHGWRDYDYAYEKPDGVYRIVVIGDSVTNGYGIEVDEIYGNQLEQRLNEAGAERRFEVLLLSLGALNTVQEVHLLATEGMSYDPDLVVLGYVLNDPGRGSSLRDGKAKNESWIYRAKALASRSSFLHFSYRRLQDLYAGIARRAGWEPSSHHVETDYFSAVHANPKRWTQVTSAFARLATIADEAEIDVVVTIFPVLYQLDTYAWESIHAQVTEVAARYGMTVLDLLPVFAVHGDAALQVDFGDYVHPNALGHRLAGDALYEHLSAQGVLRERSSRVSSSSTEPSEPAPGPPGDAG